MQRQPEPELMDDPLEAEAYSITDFSDVNEKFVEKLCSILPLSGELIAVDLGCGPGDITYRTFMRNEDWHIIGVDGSEAMLRFAQKQFGIRKPIWILSDAKFLPFADYSIDLVFTNSLLHHLLDPMPFWNEIKRIIKPNGFLFLRDLFRPISTEKAQEIVDTYAGDASSLLKKEYFRSLLSAFTPEEIQEQLSQCGLHFLTVERVTDRHVDVYGVMSEPNR
ncbi:MAG TPA: class I SAM-dependent methyltransferase [Candidatus Hydrogenedens sp.]|nr:class I SAM-dependent methyltransferase [Candidatus Hydrogenedens sp.]